MSRFELVDTAPTPERAILVGVDWRSDGWPIERSLDELERLADTAGAGTVARLTQRLDRPVPKSYIGSGKVEELKGFVQRLDADVVIFDDDLSPSQQSYLNAHSVNRQRSSTAPLLFSISSVCTLEHVKAACKSSSHNCNIFCHDCGACGAILLKSRRAAASAAGSVRVRASWKSTDA